MPTKEQYWKNPEKYRSLALNYHHSSRGKLTYNNYIIKNKSKIEKRMKEWRNEHRKEIHDYNLSCRKNKAEWAKKWRPLHRKQINEQARKWYSSHKENAIHKSVLYYIKNKEKILAVRKTKKVRQKINIYRTNWRHKNRVSEKDYSYRRNSAKSNSSFLTNNDLKTIIDAFITCPYCGIKKADTFEHIYPLIPDKNVIQGYHIKENLIRACASCNSSKSNKDPIAWCKEKGYPVPEIVIERLKIMKKMGVT